jgi:hypothetical protein
MTEEIQTFNKYHPNYSELREQMGKLMYKKQSEYTDRIDRIAMNKIKRLVSED